MLTERAFFQKKWPDWTAVDGGATAATLLALPATEPTERPMRDLIKLSCEVCGKDNYVTDKNRRTMTEKFRIKKFCIKCRSHQMHKEGKISKG